MRKWGGQLISSHVDKLRRLEQGQRWTISNSQAHIYIYMYVCMCALHHWTTYLWNAYGDGQREVSRQSIQQRALSHHLEIPDSGMPLNFLDKKLQCLPKRPNNPCEAVQGPRPPPPPKHTLLVCVIARSSGSQSIGLWCSCVGFISALKLWNSRLTQKVSKKGAFLRTELRYAPNPGSEVAWTLCSQWTLDDLKF